MVFDRAVKPQADAELFSCAEERDESRFLCRQNKYYIPSKFCCEEELKYGLKQCFLVKTAYHVLTLNHLEGL